MSTVERHGPLMPVQRPLWTLSRELASSGYGQRPVAIRMTGPLDAEMLTRSLAALAARHPGLRTRFPLVDGTPVQELLTPPAVELPLVDLAGEDDPEAAAQALVAARVTQAFDLTSQAPFDPLLMRVAADDHVLHVRSHHIVFDGWSEHVVVRDLAGIYAALGGGRDPVLPALTLNPIAIAEAQQRQAGTGGLAEVLETWGQLLTDAPAPVTLPFSRPQHPQHPQHPPSGPLSVVDVDLPRPTAERLRDHSRARRLTPFVGMLTGFVVLLARLAHTRDLVVGVTTSGRTRRKLEDVVACIANELPLRVDLSGVRDFAGALDLVHQRFRSVFVLQDVPMEQVTDALVGDGTLADAKLFTVTIQQRSFPPLVPVDTPVTFEPFDVLHGPGILHLRIHLIPTATGLRVRIHHDPAVYDTSRAEALAHGLIRIVDRGLAEPSTPLRDLEIQLD